MSKHRHPSRQSERTTSSSHRHGSHRARPSALLMALVARVRWLWLGWIEARWAALRARVGAWRAARSASAARAAGQPRFETLEPKLLLSADLSIVPDQTQVVLDRLHEAAMHAAKAAEPSTASVARALAVAVDAPTVTLTGPGTAALVAQGAGYLLQLSGTTAASNVNLTSNAQALLTGISADSAVGVLSLVNADLQGAAVFASSVGGLTLGQTLAGSRIEAAGMKKLATTGDFNGDFFLSGAAAGYTLGTVNVGGAIAAGVWSIHGPVNSITAGSTASTWRMNLSSTLVQLIVKGDASGDMALAGLQLLQVGGSLIGLHLLVGANLGDDAALGGEGAMADRFGTGTLARLRVGGDIIDSQVLISIDPVDGVLFDGNDRQLGTSAQKLQELIVGGRLLGSTELVAPLFPTTVRVNGASVNPATLAALRAVPADKLAPSLASFGLAPSSDTDPVGDNRTTADTVGLVGRTEPAAALALRRAGSATVIATTTAAADGAFSFTGIGLMLGSNDFELTLADAAGNTATGALVITREPGAPVDDVSPTLSAALLSDTGANPSDGLTSDVQVVGTATDNLAVTLLQAVLDPGPNPLFTDITASLANGSFSLSRAQLDALAGGTLSQGAHSLRIQARDAAGNATTTELSFSLDSVAPTATAFGLAAASDSGAAGDNTTTLNPVLLVGAAEAGAALSLRAAGSATVLGSTTAAADGSFSFDGINLALGDNAFVLTLADAAGNSSTRNLSITREAEAPVDTLSPVLTVALVSDTGLDAGDRITSDVRIAGTATDNVAVTLLQAVLNPTGDPVFTNFSAALVNGAFSLSRAQLDALAGGTLGQGAHTLRIQAQDAAGNTATTDLAFTLDSVAPTINAFGLAAASDSGTADDNITNINPVSLVGSADAGASLTLRAAGNATVLGTATAAADGSFGFNSINLALGSNSFELTATDAAGNGGTRGLSITREAQGGGDTTQPTVTAALALDSGSSTIDGITNDVRVNGQAFDNVQATVLLVGLDAGAGTAGTDLSSLLQADGSFSIGRAQLDLLAGGTLGQGAHTLRVVAQDAAGNTSNPFELGFSFDNLAPTGAAFGISSADSLSGNDAQTGAAVVTLQGTAEAGSIVSYGTLGLSAQVAANGRFQLPGVPLVVGDNSVTLTITDAAGNAQTAERTLTRSQVIQSDAVLDWINIALKAIQLDVTAPPVATRVLALQSVAVYDALAAVQDTPAFLVKQATTGPASAQAAAAQAAYRVLYQLYPGQRASFDAALAISLAAIADGDAKTAGIALGDQIALQVIALRANDGYLTLVGADGSSEIGKWRPTPPLFDVASDPQWANVTPFALNSADQFRALAPPALDSQAYADALNQVKSLGSASGSTRTADQTQQALFWADGGGSYTPPGHWDQIAAQIAASKGLSLSASARLMAQLNVALADAAIACWDSKYAFDFWRPVTAIQLADLDNNAGTTADANWTPLLITPSHPTYVSGHSTFSGAAVGVLAATFGDNTAFNTTSATLPGVTRSFTSFSQARDEAGMSRIYGGIHFAIDNEAGKTIGAQVAQAVLARFALTQDKQAPQVVLGSVPAATNTNLTFAGQVLDNLSGLAGASIRIDFGQPQALTLDATGRFSFTTSLALDTTVDGEHFYSIIASDLAGNVSNALEGSFFLDTVGPSLTLSGVAEGDTLGAASRFRGIALGTGSELVELSYRFDNGSTHFASFDTGSGGFDNALSFALLDVGDHQLTVTARDAAGNVTTLVRNVKIDALAPFTITSMTPLDAASNIGVTQRPLVEFSRAVNKASLNNNSFYATGPDGSRLDTTVVPSADGSFAWLFFNTPMPGAANITVHVDGSLIRAAADGAFLDGNGDGVAGGERTLTFTTVGQLATTGTKLVGRVVDPGPDLLPMSFDDIRRGPDGVIHTPDDVFLLPIVHAKVYVLGHEDQFVYTDANGFFTLDNVPAGTVKVAVDGRTATNAPSGVFFPEMVMSAELLPGVTNTMMGSMGSTEARVANADRSEVYLPRVAASVLQDVSNTQPTVITANTPAAAPDLTDEQRQSLTLTVPAGSAVGENGQALSNVKIGIATVPPELVRDMLPPGVLQHTFDITIQAPGVAAFTEPVQITFPNVFNAAPGSKLNILSFDHTSGMLVINGSGTVSADGLTVTSDEGSGIRAPGWHGVAPPGSQTDGPQNPPPPNPPPCINWSNVWDIVVDLSTAAAQCAAELAGVSDGIKAALTIADKVRDTVSQVQALIDGAKKPGVSAAELAAGFKIVGNIKTSIVVTVEALQGQANPVSKALKIAKCLEAILGGLDNICGRIQSQGDQCNTTIVKIVCVGIAAVKATLGKVNALISVAEDSLKKIGLALVCSLIDQLGTLIGAAANAQGGNPLVGGGNESQRFSASLNGPQNTVYDEIASKGQEIIDEFNAQQGDYDGLQSFAKGYFELVDETAKLDSDTAAIYSANVAALPADTYYVMRCAGVELRGRTDANGQVCVVIAPDSDYTLTLYDPVTNRVAQVRGHSQPSGVRTFIPAIGFASLSLSSLPLDADGNKVIPAYMLPDGQGGLLDSDGDGLPDVAEDIVGTRRDRSDSDTDGITDLAELQQNLNPLDGRAVATGVIGQVGLQGDAQSVAVMGSLDGFSRNSVLVATGNYGLATVDASRVTQPTLMAELNLPGFASDVAADGSRGLAAVAGGDAGLHIVDVSALAAPTLLQTVSFTNTVTRVDVRDGLAYAAVGTNLAIVDLGSGEIRATFDIGALGGSSLIDLALDGSNLFTVDSANTLRAFTVSGDVFIARGSLVLPDGGGKMFVGGGVAYVGAGAGGALAGYVTASVSDLDALTLLSGVDNAGEAGGAIALTGSGLGVTVGSLAFPQFTGLDVVRTTDPTNTGAFVTRFNLPAAPLDVAIANGLAFVADGSGGLQIVNYTSYDSQGVSPTVTILVEALDADPSTPGTQVQEGGTLRIVPTVTDDVQVRNVELLVNGQVVSNDVAFPFELFAAIPSITNGGTQVTVQVRATDTGGNETLSNAVVLDVVPDTFAPVKVSTSVAEGARLFLVRAYDVVFNEPIDTLLLNLDLVKIVRAGADGSFGTEDDLASPFTLSMRAFGQRISVIPTGFLPAGDYELRINKAAIADRVGNGLAADIVTHFTIRPASDVRAATGIPDAATAPSANPGQQIGIAVPFDPSTSRARFATVDSNGTVSSTVVNVFRTDVARGIAYFNVPMNAVTGDCVVYGQVGAVITNFADGTFPLQILPTIIDVQVESISGNGATATLLIAGTGFVEGQNSEYRLGNETVADANASGGPDVFDRYDPNLGQYISNGYARVTVALSDGVFGAINVKTLGGTSANYSVNLGAVATTALSGTPADAAQGSANAGQAITLSGAGLSATSDILLRWTNINGALQMERLQPTAASADGSSATVVLPIYVNGAFKLQLFGSASQPLLQIVPTLTSIDVQDRTVLFGSGYVEGASTYNFAGASVVDAVNPADTNIDVYYDSVEQNRSAYLNRTALPAHGLGSVSVTTAGGTSAAFALNTVRVSVEGTNLGDVGVDAAGNLWVGDQANPSKLLKISQATGAVLQTITLSNAFGSAYAGNYLGLQVLSAEMNLGGTAVPAGSLLVFNGYPNTDRVSAVNAATGAVITSLALPGNYDLTGAAFNPASGHIFLTENNGPGNRIIELDAATGAQLATITAPFNIQSWSGLAIDPTTGHLWLGAINGGTQLVEFLIDGTGALTELRRFDTTAQRINQNEISGLSFDAAGALWVASTQGEIYKLDVNAAPVATPTATLTQIIASAGNGVAANAGLAAANVGQVIELVGTNFGAGTRVLFDIRDNAGNVSRISQTPLAINAEGTRLQVLVPDAATTGDVRVVNQGGSHFAFSGSYNDAVYRNVVVSFVASAATATVAFSDGGLQDVSDESWGLDNVVVRNSANAAIFSDNFESGTANAAWSNATVNADAPSLLSRFGGRFANTNQRLSLAGLTAGQTYTVTFDLLVLDSWDGASPSNGPDLFDVSVDGVSRLRETLANFASTSTVQTFRASAGLRLQIVPTLAGIDGGRPGEDDNFNLQGSGFMEGASTVTIGGVAMADTATNLSPFDVTGARNNTLSVVAPRTLDGPIRITTEGGYAEIAGASFPTQPTSLFSAIVASANAGAATNGAAPSATTGQAIVLQGQGFTSSTLVQFQGIDDSGRLGTLTRTGSAGNNGTTLSVVVPALARTGNVTVLGSGASLALQVVPTLRAVGGSVAAGNVIVLEGTGLTANDLIISIDGRGVGSLSLRTIVDGTSTTPDQQLLTLTVPNGIGAGVITVSTAGGTSVLRSSTTITALTALTPAEVGDIYGTALNTGLALNQSVAITGAIAGGLDVDLYSVALNAGDQLTVNMPTSDLYAMLRIFDAAGNLQAIKEPYFNPTSNNNNTAVRWTAPAAGTFYFGVSGYSNTTYNPGQPNSGNDASYLGDYTLAVERAAGNASHLNSASATATSGSPANAGVASANVGQVISFSGSGLQAGDELVFTTLDTNGNFSETSVTTTVDLASQTLSATVPTSAVTGRVRLERDAAGVLLQIVPTLSDVTMTSPGNGFTGNNLQLAGTGFAEGAMTVIAGDTRIDDLSRNYGINVFSSTGLNLTVPTGLPSGPIRVSTVGGTSAAFGITLTGVSAAATTGAAADAGVASANPGQTITLSGVGFDNSTDVVFSTVDGGGNLGDVVLRPSTVSADGSTLQVQVPLTAVSGQVRVIGAAGSVTLQIVPAIVDVQVESISGDGSSATLLIAGTGFIEGQNSEYRLGATTVIDASAGAGPDVFDRYDPVIGQYISNGYARVTVALSDGVFGAINVKTLGGTSANYSVNLGAVATTALSGTPADAAQGSANAGQAITLSGAGLSATSDILLRWTNINGALQMERLQPTAASADGSSATVVLPIYVNGAFKLQLFGSASQPLLQIVPTLTSIDVQDRTVVFGSGYVEGASTYNFAGASVVDVVNPADTNIDVYYDSVEQNRSAYLNRTALPAHGLGDVRVTTAGGTSAAFALNTVRVSVEGTNLGDVGVDAAGNLWVGDQANPSKLLKISQATGAVLQTITLSNAFGSAYAGNYLGLQVLSAEMNLGGTAVPAGSLLVFNGYPNTDRVSAVNAATGAVITSLALPGNYDLTGAAFNPASGHIFLTENNGPGNRIIELDAATGAQLATITAPFNIQSWSGLAIDPTTGHLWLGAINGGTQLVEFLIDGTGALTELRRFDTTAQRINQNEISGLSFDAAGRLWVASTQGEIYRLIVN